MPRDPADTMRAQAAQFRARAAQLRKEAERLELAAEAAEKGAADLPPIVSTAAPRIRHSRDMPESTQAHKAAIARGRQSHGSHPFVAAVLATGISVSEWARRHNIPPATAATWYSTGKARRSIPRAQADAIEREFGRDEQGRPVVPATEDTWPNGIRD